MIPLFVGYALFVWYLSARYRRTMLAYACALSGVALLVVLCWGHLLVGRINPELMIQNMQILMYPYTVAVGSVAFFIASLPKTHPPGCCGRCGYNLAGLDVPVMRCPECGGPVDPPRAAHRPSGMERIDLRSPDVRVISTTQSAEGHAGQQDDPWHGRQQDPPQG
jgi:hypothetical protein